MGILAKQDEVTQLSADMQSGKDSQGWGLERTEIPIQGTNCNLLSRHTLASLQLDVI